MKRLSTLKPLCSSKKNANVSQTIAIVTGTRAEWGLLYPLAKAIQNHQYLKLHLIVTGAHLSPSLGNTYQEIENDGFSINKKIPILHNDNTNALNTAHTLANTIINFSKYFSKNRPDMVILLGDRYEAFGVAISAANLNIPIAHISGGESTQGANDEYMRHCITKMSYLHFPSTHFYAKRIIQLGEDPQRVFNVGSLAVENIHNAPFMSKTNLAQKIQVKKAFLDRFCVLTFHSTTLDNTNPSKEITLILQSLLQSNFNILATKANADAEGHSINLILEEYAKKYPDKITLCASLGRVMYLSSLKFAAFVIGNSSSGLSEAPILGIPTINIGDRQKGRFMPQSVVSITPNQQEPQQYTQTILNTITYVTNNAFLSQMTHSHPFGEGKTTEHITDIIESTLKNNTINLKKAFYMLENPNF